MVNSTASSRKIGDITVNGHQKFDGAVVADNIRLYGNGRFLNGVTAEQLKIIGSCSVDGDSLIQQVYCQGHSRFHILQAESIQVTGSIAAEQLSSSTFVEVKGSIQIKRALQADNVAISHQGIANVNRIAAEKSVVIQADRLSMLYWLLPKSKRGKFDVVMGCEVKANDVKSSLIVGEHVVIGANSIVAKVIYSDHLSIAPGAKVAEVIHMPQHRQIWRLELC